MNCSCRSQYGYSGERTDEKSEECDGHGKNYVI